MKAYCGLRPAKKARQLRSSDADLLFVPILKANIKAISSDMYTYHSLPNCTISNKKDLNRSSDYPGINIIKQVAFFCKILNITEW